MGTEVQSKMYLHGYYPLRDLNNNADKGTWPLHREQKTLRSGQCLDIFLTIPDMDGYEEYEKELLRQTILKHETIFRNQLHELHRLYKTQRDLMNNIRSNEPDKHLMSAGPSQSSNVFPSEYDKKRWHMSLMNSCYGRPSTSGVDSIQSHFNSVQGTIMQSNFGPIQSGVRWKDYKSLEPKSSKLQRRLFDLEIPANEFINNNAEQQGVSGVSRVHSYPPNKANEIAYKRDGNLSICIGASTGCHADAFSPNMHLRETPWVDLNETIQVEEASASAITGHNTHSKEEMQRQDSSASAYSGFQLLAKDFSQNLRNGRDGAVSNLHFENECQQQDQLSYPFEAGKTKSNRSYFCGIFCPEDFPKPCESSQVETPKAHDPATCFPSSDQSKIENHRKRTIFGVEISDINNDSSVVASHTLGLQTPLVPKSDVANSESFTISPGTKPPGSLRQHLISTQGSLYFNTSQSNKSSKMSMQSPEVLGELLKDTRAEVSYQKDVYLASQLESKKLQGCQPSVCLGFPNDISDRHCSFEQFQQHGPQKYPRDLGCDIDVNSSKEINMDAVSLNNPFKVICQQNIVSVDWPRNRDNSQGACSWLRPMPNCNGKYSRDREGFDHMSLSSWQNHSLHAVNRTEMRKGPSQSFVLDSSPETHADDGEHGKIEIGVCPSNRKILGFPIMDKPHVLKDLPSPSSPSKPSSLASAIDNGNSVGLVITDLAHDPMSTRSGVLHKFEDRVEAKGWVKHTAASRHQIDLNICVTEEEVLFTPSSPISTNIDLEAPVVIETEIVINPVEGSPESKSREPFDVLQDESRVPHEGPIRVAADALVAISSSHVRNLPGNAADNLQEHATCHHSEASLAHSLQWLADIISSYKGDIENEVVEVSMGKDNSFQEELIPDGIDYFEFMTLNLTESEVGDYCYKPQTLENPKDENTLPRRPRRGQTRRGRQRKDFQKDILPSLTSLSRNEVTEDLQTIEGLFKATGGTWQSCLAHRNSGTSGSGRGSRRSGVSHPSPTENSVCLPQIQQAKCIELGFEEKSLTGWGKRTRRPPRQRCLINSPLPLK